MDFNFLSTGCEFTALLKNHVRPKSESPDHDAYRGYGQDIGLMDDFLMELYDGPEEQNVDLNSTDSSYTMRESTSLPSANAFGKCSNRGLTSGALEYIDLMHRLDEFLMELYDPEEENMELNSNDSSYTMRESTSLPSANAVGKCSNLGLTSGALKVYHESTVEVIGELFHEPNNGVSPLREEEKVDLNSNDSSNTMRVSTSLPSANAFGKCSNLHMTCCGFSKEAGEKTPHVANKLFQIPVEEEKKLHSCESSEIIVLSSPQPARPAIFSFSGWTIPSSSSNSSSLWILDSGATHHACFSRASFETFTPIFNFNVPLPNGQPVPLHGTGSVHLFNDLTLQNVLYVPEFQYNLLSISALTQQHPYVVSFNSDHFGIEDPIRHRRIVMGRQSGNLYTLDLSQTFLYSPS